MECLKKLYHKFPVVLLGYKDENFEYNFTLNGSSFFLGDIVMIAMDECRYALNEIKRANCFTVNVPTGILLKELFKELESCGIIGGMDEFGILNTLNCVESEGIDAPIIKNCSMNIECEVFEILDVINSHNNEKIIMGKVKKRILNKRTIHDSVFDNENLRHIIFDKNYNMTFYKYLTHIKWM